MFNFLKEKIKSWIKTSEEKLEKKEEVVSAIKEKTKKPKKQTLEKKKAEKIEQPIEEGLTKEQIKEEREISEKIIEDIKKEKLEIKPVEEKIKEKFEEERKLEEERREGQAKPEKRGFFARIKEKFTAVKITEDEFEEIFTRLELILLENNTALEVVEKIRQDLKEKLVDKEIKKEDLEKEIIESLKTSIEELLIEPENLIEKIKGSNETFVIAFFGINGSGKTTTIAKLAHLLKKNNISCILAACDTFRAAAIDQLQKHGDKLGIKVIRSQYGADPTSVAFDAVKHAKAHSIKAVLIDTAGRMHTKENLIREMEKLVKVIRPDLKIFIAESITGNDLIEQAKTFNEAIGLDGAILSKADVDEKGGSTISLSYIIKKPIFFLGTGQNYDDLEVFNKKKIIKSLGLD